MVRLCSALVTALAGPAAPEHPPSATASAADPRTPRYVSLILPLASATLRQDTGSARPIWLAGGADGSAGASRVNFRRGRSGSRRGNRGPNVDARQRRGGARPCRHADRSGRPAGTVRRSGAVGGHGPGPEGDPSAVLPRGRTEPAGQPAPAA